MSAMRLGKPVLIHLGRQDGEDVSAAAIGLGLGNPGRQAAENGGFVLNIFYFKIYK